MPSLAFGGEGKANRVSRELEKMGQIAGEAWPHLPYATPTRIEPPSAAACAALQAEPGFSAAMRAVAEDLAALAHGNRLRNLLLNDRACALLGLAALYYDAAGSKSGGATASRLQALCVAEGICSRGRAGATVAMMRLAGLLATASDASDRRLRRLVPTERLLAEHRRRWVVIYRGAARLLPQAAGLEHAIEKPAFTAALLRAMGDGFLAGYRVLDPASPLQLFARRDAGMLVLFRLLVDVTVPDATITVSISALAKRFGVSRPHVRKLLRDAATEGLIKRQDEQLVLQPPLWHAAGAFFARMFLYLAECGRVAAAATARAAR